MMNLSLPSEDKSLSVKRLDQAYRRVGVSVAASVLISTLVVVALWPLVAHRSLLAWLVAISSVLAVRYLFARRFLRLNQVGHIEPGTWTTGYVIGAATTGLCWGVTVFFFPEFPLDQSTMLLVFVIAGVSAFASASMAPIPLAANVFMLFSLLPVALWLFSGDQRMQCMTASITLIYLGVMLLQSRHIHGTVTHLLVSTEQNNALTAAVQEREARHRAQSNLLQSVLESASDVSVWALDRDYRYLMFNAKHRENAKRLRGVDIAVGMNVLDMSQREELRESCRQSFGQVLAGHALCIEVREEVVQDGSTTYEYYEHHGSPIRNEDGEVVGLTIFTHDITERKRMESKLKDSHDFLNTVINSISDQVSVKDSQHRWVLLNDCCCTLIGHPREVLLGKSDYDFLPKEQADVFWEKDNLVFMSGEVNVNEEVITSAAGVTRHLLTQKSPFTFSDGKRYIVATSRDITERKCMEIAMAQREREFRSLAENLPLNIARWDCQGRYVYLNPSLERLFGGADAVIGKTKSEAFPDGRFAEMEAAILNVVATRTMTCARRQLVPNESGDVRLHDLKLLPEFNAAGEIIGVLGIGNDLTDNYRMEDALQDNLRFTRELIEAIPGPVFYKDADGIYLGCNAAFERFYALRRDDLIGKGVFDMWPKDLAERYHAADRQLIENPGIQIYEAQMQTPLGRRDVVFHKATFARADGSVGGQVGVILDITERKQAQQKLELLNRAIDMSGDAVYLMDEQLRFNYVNETACRALGYSREELLSMDTCDIDPDLPREVILKDIKESPLGVASSIESRHRAKDGHIYPVEICGVQFENDGVRFSLSVVRDITERKFAEQYEQFRSHTLEVIAGDHSLPSILEEVVRGVEQLKPGMICSILLLDSEGRCLRKGAAPSLPDFYNEAVDGLEIGIGVGCCGTAAATGERVVIENIQTHPHWEVVRELVIQAGLVACWSQPILAASGKVLGTFAIYHRESHSPSAFDIALIEKLARLASIAIEHKQAEEAVQRSEQLVRSVIDATPDWIFIKDQDHRYQLVNQGYANALHIAPEDFIGKNDLDLGFPEELVKGNPEKGIRGFWADDQLVMEGNVTQIYPDDPATIDGVVHTFHSIKVPLRDAEGQARSVLAFCRDITERKQAENYLEEMRARLQTVMDTIPDMVWLKDADGVYMSCNAAFERFFGASEAEIVGKTDYDFVDAELADFFRVKDRKAIESGEVRINEEWVTFAHDHRRALLETRKVPLFDASGKVAGVLGIGRDITERQQAQDALFKRQEEFRALAENSPDIIMRYDRDCRRIYVNPAFMMQTGKTAQELLGETPISYSSLPQAVLYQKALQHVIAGGREIGHEYTGPDMIVTDFRIVPERDACGKISSVLAIGRDITERKQAERAQQDNFEEIIAINQQLEESARDLEEQAVKLDASREQLQLTEAWYRGILHSAPDGMLVVNQRGIITLVNAQLCRMFGYADDELNGLPIEQLVPQGMRDAHVNKRVDFLGGHSRMSRKHGAIANLRGRRKDGSEFAVDIALSRLPDSVGDMGVVCAAIRDITEQQRLETALAKREHESRTLIENTPDAIARHDCNGAYIFANPALADSFKGGIATMLGRKPTEIRHTDHSAMYEEKIREVVTTGSNTEFELVWPDKDGHDVCSHVRLTAEFDALGTVVTVLAVGRDITELNAFRQKIHQMAFYDALTSLPNRALFNDRLRQMLTDAQWHEQKAGVMLLDLDRFKAINDSLGHPAGDELLREVALRLSFCVRSYDTVARLGGDEFAILLPDIRNGDDLGRVGNKILAAFNAPFMLEGKEVFTSTSIGIAVFPEDSANADDLIKQADSAMYFAKRSGRNNFRFYSKDLTASAGERLSLESELRRAVERDELELYYQPKIRLADNQLIGSEALLRWNNPQRGLVPPDQFISIAEDSGLIIEIGEWVLRDACRTACDWNGAGKPLHKVAINLSARQFQSNNLLETVCHILDETGCLPSWIELEITESLLLDEQGDVLETLKAFRIIGISIAIDDFGTGYSSLSYLARFPINTLKIDRSFIRTVTTEHYRAELVKAILSIARCLGQDVVAEGVETTEQAEFLLAHGCQIAQGYLFSKPIPKAAFEAFYARTMNEYEALS